MRVTWVAFAPITRTPDGALTSELASARYRILLPMQHLGGGYQHSVLAVTSNEIHVKALGAMQADVVVFSKSMVDANEHLLAEAHKHGARVIFDLCDYHYEHPTIGEHYKRMTQLADQVVCNTPVLAEHAAAFAKVAPVVIEDPYEGPAGEARFAPGERLKLLWFGHPTNFDSLNHALPSLLNAAERAPIDMTLLTLPMPKMQKICDDITSHSQERVSMRLVPWSLAKQWQALADTDAVFIPHMEDNVRKSVKSANRVVESLRAGRMVLANPIPSYEAFEPWVWMGRDFGEGIAWLDAKRPQIPLRIQEAQRYIEQRFAPRAIAAQWEQVLGGRITS